MDLPAIAAQGGDQDLIVQRLVELANLDPEEGVFVFELGVFTVNSWQANDKMGESGLTAFGGGQRLEQGRKERKKKRIERRYEVEKTADSE